MFSRITSAHVLGIEAVGVEVEADLSSIGVPSFSVVGLAEGAAKESKDRVRAALKNIDFNIFARPITVNLAPADIKKEGSHFDLALAVSFLAAIEGEAFNTKDTLFLGELALDGVLRGVSGVLCMCMWGVSAGIKRVVLPADNALEASLVPNLEIYPFEHLSGVIPFLKGERAVAPFKGEELNLDEPVFSEEDFADIKGQFQARRAAEIACAGLHNMIMTGAPGSGKTMIAKRLVSILPPMSLPEALLTTKVHSVAGLLTDKGTLIRKRPFIAPHHTASNVAIIGGGAKAMPGHVSIATNGVLFLDEILEFNRSVLEVLRQPMEDGDVTIARAGRTVKYPAAFMLVAAANPCPCGYYGDTRRECVCAPQAIERYRSRLSGPLMDRIDLHVNVPSVDFKELDKQLPGESSESIRKRVVAAHEIQKERFKGTGVFFNSRMGEKMLKERLRAEDAAMKLISGAMERLALSGRAYGKVLKVSRTIADLEGSVEVKTRHVAEALQYRTAAE